MTRSILKSVLLIILLTITPVVADEQSREREERAQELYEDGQDYLDDHEWSRAASKFRELARMKGAQADAGLYWLAYSQYKMGQGSDALTTVVELQKAYPKSRYASDAKALEVEIRQLSGQRVEPADVVDEDVKLMAIQGLMNTDPERAIPILEKIITGTATPKMKDKALFVLTQSPSPRAQEVLARIARGNANPELQARALRYLGVMGGENSRRLLADVYASTKDVKVKKTILRSYMQHGDKGRLLAVAKSESDAGLRGDAVRQLGIIGARNELAELYSTETSVDVKEDIIKAMFISGSHEKLGQLALKEPNPELRAAAIKSLGLMGKQTAPILLQLYNSDPNPEIRSSVIKGLFLQGNVTALVDLAKKEKDPRMRKEIVSKLALMNSEEATAYLLDVLNQ